MWKPEEEVLEWVENKDVGNSGGFSIGIIIDYHKMCPLEKHSTNVHCGVVVCYIFKILLPFFYNCKMAPFLDEADIELPPTLQDTLRGEFDRCNTSTLCHFSHVSGI